MTLTGIFTPITTPFTDAGEIDVAGLKANVARLLPTRLTGIVVLGSNGEAPQLDDDEADRAIAAVREAVPKGRTLLAGTGRESTRATIAATKRAAAMDVDAVMVRTPSFYKPQMTTEAFVRFYREVADHSPRPVLLYNVTMYTAVNLHPDAVATLSEHPNIVGLKDSGNDMLAIGDYVTRTRPGFTVLCGSGQSLYSAAMVGAHGAVLALSNVVPDECVDIFEWARAGRADEALALQRKVLHIARLIGSLHGVPGLKAALDLLGFRGGAPRSPLQPAPDA
ncbi:MAG: dihydrodipicolinate synthase family protein, partial [Acidobacteriota bacterium]